MNIAIQRLKKRDEILIAELLLKKASRGSA